MSARNRLPVRRVLPVVAVLAAGLCGCGGSSAAPPATSTPRPTITAQPTAKLPTATALPSRPIPTARPPQYPGYGAIFAQEHVGPGEYQLLNTVTEQFVQASAGRARRVCSAGRPACAVYLQIRATVYSGNVQTRVSRTQFRLAAIGGASYPPTSPRDATRIVPSDSLLPKTVLQPDDDGDYAMGVLVFAVPPGAGRFTLQWNHLHVATFRLTSGHLAETP